MDRRDSVHRRLHGVDAGSDPSMRRVAARCAREIVDDHGLPHDVTVADLGGDLHPAGLPLLLGHEGRRWVWKPRSSWGERLLLDLAVRFGDGSWPVPVMRDAGTSSLCDFVTTDDVLTADEASLFFRRAGALIAVAHATRTTDLHQENIVCHGAAPVPIDAEFACSPGLAPLAGELREEVAWVENGVMNTHLLPLFADSAEPGGIGSVASTVDADGRRRPGTATPRDHDGRPHLPFDHLAELEHGFRTCHRRLAAAADDVADTVRAFADRATRVAVRPTRTYVRLWRTFGPSPSVRDLRRALDHEGLLRGAAPDDAVRDALVAGEAAELARGLVPMITAPLQGTDLLIGDQVIAGALPVSPLAAVLERLDRLGPEDEQAQARLLRSAFEGVHQHATAAQAHL